MSHKLDLQIRQLHQEMSDEPPTMQYRLSSDLPWSDVASHTRLLNGNIVDEGGTIVSYGRGNSPGVYHVDDAAYFDPALLEQVGRDKLRGEESLRKLTQIDEDLALKAMVENTQYKVTPVDPKVAQLVDPATIGYLPPLSKESMDGFKEFVKAPQEIFVTGMSVVSEKPSAPLEVTLVPAEPGDPHVFSLGDTGMTVKPVDIAPNWRGKNPCEEIYTDGDRRIYALADFEDRGGGVNGHIYQAQVEPPVGDNYPVIRFQNGNPAVYGINGHTNETILSILIHRMEYLDGLFPCDENKEGLKHLKLAKEAFEARAKRMQGK